MNAPQITSDPLYQQAKAAIGADPAIGKKRLADLLSIKTPTSRRLLERWRGETQGHSNHPDYQRVCQLKVQHPDWGAVKVSQALGLNIDYAKLHLALWIDAQGYQSAGQSLTPSPAEPEAPPRGAELQISDDDANQAVSYRGTRIRTIRTCSPSARRTPASGRLSAMSLTHGRPNQPKALIRPAQAGLTIEHILLLLSTSDQETVRPEWLQKTKMKVHKLRVLEDHRASVVAQCLIVKSSRELFRRLDVRFPTFICGATSWFTGGSRNGQILYGWGVP